MATYRPKRLMKPKLLTPIGATFDIPTGYVVTGARGESIIMGGVGGAQAVVGMGNRFKSTILHYMALRALYVSLEGGTDATISTYDTEINMTHEGLYRLAKNVLKTDKSTLFDQENPLWSITDKAEYFADEWFDELKEYFVERTKGSTKDMVAYEALIGPDKKPLKMWPPTLIEVDSMSEFEATNTIKMQEENALGDKGGNTLFMRQGLVKARFTMELPRLIVGNNAPFFITAHVGSEVNIPAGPIAAPPSKKLQFLKLGEKIKGVSEKFFFLLWSAYLSSTATPFINNNTKDAEYPSPNNNPLDLHKVKLVQLRNKNGPTGYTLEIMVSQTDGVLPSLTEFHNIKVSGRYGIGGTVQNYYLDLYPDVKLRRTNIRSKIDSDPKLRRALNITSEMCQIERFWPGYAHLKCTPLELRNDLEKMGYDWDKLLDTRGYMTANQYTHKKQFLSTVDLLKMRAGLYKPYWYKDKLKVKEK